MCEINFISLHLAPSLTLRMRVKKMPENNLKMFVTLLSPFDQNLKRMYYTCFEDTCHFYSNFLLNAKSCQEFEIGLCMEQESLM